MATVLGKNPDIDRNVLFDCVSARNISIEDTIIGDRARIRSGTVIYTNTRIGHDLATGHNVVIREENIIGDSFCIWNNSVLDYGCTIGNNVRIHNNVYVAQFTTLEDDSFLGPGVVIGNDPHPLCGLCLQGPTIKRGARIGLNVTLLPRVVIGEYSLVGAGSVVTKDIPQKCYAFGNPARVVGSVDDLECPFDLVDKPYVEGRDVFFRGGSRLQKKPMSADTEQQEKHER